jgi:hypothetical protein
MLELAGGAALGLGIGCGDDASSVDAGGTRDATSAADASPRSDAAIDSGRRDSSAPAGIPRWVSELPLWQWYEIPNTDLATQSPPSVRTFGVPSAKLHAWCGAALKREGSVYIVGGGGGHSDYAGNEVNALALNTETPRWVELRPSTAADQVYDGTPFYADLRPAPAHTYLNAHFIDATNQYVIFCRGGISFGGAGGVPLPPADWAYPASDAYSKVFDFARNDWELAPSPSVAPHPRIGSTDVPLSFLHPVTGDFYMSPSHSGGWWRWVRESNEWTETGGGNRSPWYCGIDVDPTRDRVLVFGGYSPTDPVVLNVDGTREIDATFGGLGRDALRIAGGYAGVAYDEHEDRFFCIHNEADGIHVLTVHAETFEVAAPPITGAIPAARAQGLHNSCRFVPELKGLVVANRYDGNVMFLRTSE